MGLRYVDAHILTVFNSHKVGTLFCTSLTAYYSLYYYMKII
ncbi:hypothetical protein VA7868_02108 [Vibrio aerogenes CECT 7868]|uniref:Uncharacterized protein n=1 Tax=Vibrio aerogenes CECT 7868 TaxID=1216006 RepID=A0A1M5YZJ2_9VIBR|nr:hypothetical protein VA7868_02108 [Vibrio aerogenes CECT 7868]